MGAVALLGFASGLPLSLTGSTLQAYLTVWGLDLQTIGAFSLTGLPYTLKFLWAPLMDRFAPRLFGRRRGWMILLQLLLAAAILGMAGASPRDALGWLARLAVLVAFLSASQDIVVDAYRTDVLRADERGMGAAVTVTGYRIAMLVSGAFALLIADAVGFGAAYVAMAVLMGACTLATLAAPAVETPESPPRTLREAVLGPLGEFFARPGAIGLLVLILLYRLGDVSAATLTTAFLIDGVGFSPGEVGMVNKGVGLGALIGGGIVGGVVMRRIGLFRSLLAFAVLQAVTNLAFMGLALIGQSYPALMGAVILEKAAGGMGATALVALLMGLCDLRYSATQFALLSAISALPNNLVGPAAGALAEAAGWVVFYGVTAAAGLLVLAVLPRRRATIEAIDAAR